MRSWEQACRNCGAVLACKALSATAPDEPRPRPAEHLAPPRRVKSMPIFRKIPRRGSHAYFSQRKKSHASKCVASILSTGGNANLQRNRVRRNTQPAPTCGLHNPNPNRHISQARAQRFDLERRRCAMGAPAALQGAGGRLIFCKNKPEHSGLCSDVSTGNKKMQRAAGAPAKKLVATESRREGRLQLSRRAERDFLRKGGTVERATDYL